MSFNSTAKIGLSPFAQAVTGIIEVTTKDFKKTIEATYGDHADLLGVGSSDVSHINIKDLEVVCG